MSKKILAFILAACMTISMVACGSSEDSVSEKNSSSDSSTVDESTSEDDLHQTIQRARMKSPTLKKTLQKMILQ